MQEREDLQDQFDHLQRQFNATVVEAQQNETKAKLEFESSRNALSNFEASYKKAISLLQVSLMVDNCMLYIRVILCHTPNPRIVK